MRKIFDISPSIHSQTPVWPGDQSFTKIDVLQLAHGESVNLSTITTTVHIGAHADAPNHYHPQGVGMAEVELDPYIGECEVITVQAKEIGVEHCRAAVGRGRRRILFRTLSFDHQASFAKDFSYFSYAAVNFMGEQGVKLIGIDTPSVDAFSSKDLPSHQALWRWRMRNLEGLDLNSVADGVYELIALPLKMVGLDGSPVRAVLREK